ncbi:type 1 glutamine amidotransferase [Myxococcus sp. MISCRS1]|jgi:protease I|uniref:type 1 glutamine amidotransferase domain-containing protein n=1 Tax=Myxococcus TaxID=32 RepID=UPI001141C20E|nr:MULTISPECIES: type 1 glutamine amidotransferase domain-containing protein [Myxococcus]BDT31667.1 type 1 glutamine amidotransferase [Myxococcus sp. MH1]MBZ4397615.1 type 1 glutamine amidotransferase [Myxococcus sp. AS-1-15]MBZ4407817.1 type 1 glutamine amidotransferase [Myxococcus sp. XM-1-1-1]MCK8497662.1 type 1 glutamine amidotransferase [Myxococcus fulvus]MCY0998264.1 type 1 glutamine amidotransferase [Myxococcus sp. MISCRS1]
MKKLKGLRVAVLATSGFEQVELTRPVKKLQRQGAEVTIVSLLPGHIRGMNHMLPGKKVRVDATLRDVKAADFDAVLLPGGLINPDTLRQSALAKDFVHDADSLNLPMAIICHAPWLLISAGLTEGRTLTSWPGIQDDVKNSGALWRDDELVRDDNWVSSRGPQDLPAFERAMVELFAEKMPEVRERLRQAQDEHPVAARYHPTTEESGRRWPRLLAGSLATAAISFGVRRLAASR